MAGTALAPIDDNCFAPEHIADPHAYYHQLRAYEPVHWNTIYEFWAVTGYEELVWLYRHAEVATSGMPEKPFAPIENEQCAFWYRDIIAPFFNDFIIMQSRPKHLTQRKLVHKFFTPTGVERWRPIIAKAINELLDDAERDGQMEIMSSLATPLPLFVIAEMMGVPESGRMTIRHFTEKIQHVYHNGSGAMQTSKEGIEEFTEYIEPLIAEREKAPRDDYISVLVQGKADGILSYRELVANAVQLLFAGHETTINLIGNGVIAMAKHPDAWERLHADPDGMVKSFTEEVLRYDGSVSAIDRNVGPEPFELAGEMLMPGQSIRLINIAANRDPRQFPDPDVFMIDRSPNLHAAFGSGIHHCLGAALARIEGQEAFRAIAKRFDRIELMNDPVEYVPNFMVRSPISVEVELEARR